MTPTLPKLLLAAALLSSCGGASTPQALAELTVDLLNKNDFAGYSKETVATPQEIIDICPSVTSFQVDSKDIASGFNDCLKRGRFGKAKVVSVNAKLGSRSAATCGAKDPVEFADSIEVTVDTGSGAYTFKINDAVRTKNGWKVTNDLKCP